MLKKFVWIILGTVIGLTLTAFNNSSAAPSFPEKPITLIAWSTPGGGSDTTLRMIAPIAEKHFGKPLVIVNKPGGGGVVGMKYLQSLPNDGYNVLLITSSIAEVLNLGGKDLKPQDFDYVLRLVEDPLIIAVTTTSKNPLRSWKDIIDKAKESPGNQKWAGSFFGSKSHMLAYLISKKVGIKTSIVPFLGTADAVVALLGNHVDVFVGNPRELMSHAEVGNVKFIATFGEKRLDEFPDLPTLREIGVDVVGNHWRGIVVKKGTSPEIIKILHDGFKKAISDSRWIDFVKKNGLVEGYLNANDLYQLTKKETELIKETLKEIGLK